MACSGKVKKISLAVIVLVAVIITVATVTAIVVVNKSEEPSRLTTSYRNGAVASDSYTCSKVGVNVMKDNGSVVDAAIATLFCLGVVHPHSSGIGGGGFMLTYERATRKAKYIDFRETAPGVSTDDMFVNKTAQSKQGVMSVAVPGEVLAMYNAWLRYGKLPWKRLVQPSIDLASKGFEVDEPLSIIIANHNDSLFKEKGFREVYYDETGSPRKQGDIITDPVFAKTLKEISEDPYSFYNGSIAKEMVEDIQGRGGILTEDDLKNFTAKEREVLVSSMSDDDILYTTSAPSSGSTMIMILNILKGFKFGPDALSTSNIVQTWHKIIEAFKFGYAYRPYLGDPDYNSHVEKSEKVQTNATYAEELRKKIWENTTHESIYYGGFYRNEPDFGTTHLSAIGPYGDAVSVTSTVGYYFGAKIRSYKTGIVYNNHMSTFSLPNVSKNYQPKSSEYNNIAPGKRSVSTSCPTIVVNKDGNVRMIVGGSGGLRITSGVPTVLMNKLWFGLSLEQSISQPRLHHQLYPNSFKYETKKKFRMKQSVIDGLRRLGHKGNRNTRYCAIQGVYRDNSGNIFAMSDPRKSGIADGF